MEQYIEIKKFTGLKEQPTLIEVLNNIRGYISSLDKYYCVNGELVDNELIEALDGEYVKLEDVLKFFDAENE